MSALKLEFIYPVNFTFASAVGCRTYRLHNRSQKYSGKMAVRTATLAKCTETTIKYYKIENSDPVAILSIFGQVKRACDSNDISEGVVTLLLPFFMAYSSAASLRILMTPRKDSGDY